MRLADAQLAQNKYDEALKTLSGDVDPAFKATVEELRGDIFVAKKDIDSAKKAYQAAWDSLLESVGVLVEDPQIERPILETQVEES